MYSNSKVTIFIKQQSDQREGDWFAFVISIPERQMLLERMYKSSLDEAITWVQTVLNSTVSATGEQDLTEDGKRAMSYPAYKVEVFLHFDSQDLPKKFLCRVSKGTFVADGTPKASIEAALTEAEGVNN